MINAFQLSVEGVSAVYALSPDLSLLDQLTAFGFTQRKACRNGVCQICDAHLLSGSVSQRYPKSELTAPAHIYLCTSYAQSDISLRLIRAEMPKN